MNILILGPQGSGKGTQAQRIAASYAIPHIATGDMLREAMAAQTELGLRVKPIYDAGQLVPDDLMIELIRERTHTCYLGDRTRRHDWGRGCGECPACRLRAEGWERYRTGPAGATEHRPRRVSTPQERNEKCSRANAPANGFATKSTRPLDDR